MRLRALAIIVCAITALAGVDAVAVPAGSAATTGTLGATVIVHGTVPQGDTYQPAFYVDWRDGACPADMQSADAAARGNTTRGLGVADQDAGAFTGDIPVSAKLTLQQADQRVCFYGGNGMLGDSQVLTATPSLPPFDSGVPARAWNTAAIPKTHILTRRPMADPLAFGLYLTFKGRRPTGGTITCERKRFNLVAARIHLNADDSISYSGVVRPDNSNEYDHPIPARFRGRATLRFHAPLGIGRAPLPGPITGTGDSAYPAVPPLGEWGLPVNEVDARFSAPGYRAFSFAPLCPKRLKALANPSVPTPVMIGQGTDQLGDNGQAGQPFQYG